MQPVTSDQTGDTLIDGIFSGVAMNLEFTLNEWNASAVKWLTWFFSQKDPLNATDAAHATNLETSQWGRVDPAGSSLFQRAKPLILTSCFDGINPKIITFPRTVLAPDFQVDTLFSYQQRLLTLRMLVFPCADGGLYTESGIDTAAEVISSALDEFPVGCASLRYFYFSNWA
jgi:hypothetical protein